MEQVVFFAVQKTLADLRRSTPRPYGARVARCVLSTSKPFESPGLRSRGTITNRPAVPGAGISQSMKKIIYKNTNEHLCNYKIIVIFAYRNKHNATMKKSNTNTAPKWVAYYRVSTKKQGLGLEAQRDRVHKAAQESGAVIIDEIEEKESGKECDRPGLNKVLAIARRHGATIAVAKFDRLSRDTPYLSGLILNSGLSFYVGDLSPEALRDPLMFSVSVGLVMKERQLISERTAAALQALKVKGVKLGRPDAATSITPEMRAAADEAKRRKADENPNNIAAANEIRRYLSHEGNKRTLQAVADHLTNSGLYTARGVFHTPQSVKLLCKRFNINIK